MRKLLPVGLGASLFVLMIAAPVYYKLWHDHEFRNPHVVEEGVLYRSGQMPLPRLQQFCMNHRIRTVVCLREGDKQDDQTEETWIKARGLNFVRIPPRVWWPDESGNTPADESVAEFRKVMDDPANYPVLVHCYAGIHRTGTMCAVFRMDYQGWTNDEAMAEMRTFGYTMLDDHEDILGYLTRYHPPRDRKKIRTVYVPTPQNVSTARNFESYLATAVINELDGRRADAPRVTSDRNRADSELEMKIVNSTTDVGIQIEVVWRDLRGEHRGGMSNKGCIALQEKLLPGDPAAPPPALVTLTAQYVPQLGVANVMNSREAARKIVNMMETWP